MEPGEKVAGRYLLERLAARGGMGAVFEAHDEVAHLRVAVKVVTPSADIPIERVAREARLLAELEHPYVVRYYEHGTLPSGETYLVMEWVDGVDLLRLLRLGPLAVDAAVGIAQRVAEALAVAHARGVVHRDIKPSNVLLVGGDPRRVKLLDFGIARVRIDDSDELTETGMVMGTPGYMAPEQAQGSRHVDARADVYALGSVLFRLLTRRAPFVGRDPTAVLAKIVLEEAPRVSELRPGVPAALDDIVARMLANRPENRPADGAEVARELAALGDLRGAERTSSPGIALTGGEQRLVSVVLAPHVAPAGGEGSTPGTQTEDGATMPARPSADLARSALVARLRDASATYGARVVFLADGSVAAVISGTGSASDLARRAARCALAFAAATSGARVALSTGRAEISGRLPVGDAIDRALSVLDRRTEPDAPSAGAHPVRIDDVTAALLGDRFEVRGEAGDLELVGESRGVGSPSRLLGRETPFVGRDRELAAIEATYDECASEPAPRVVVITGAPGEGKSRLRREVLRRIGTRSPPPVVLVARGDPMRAGSAFSMLAELISSVVGDVAEPAGRHRLAGKLAPLVPPDALERILDFVGELTGAPATSASVQLDAARESPVLMGDQIRRACEDVLGALAARGPVVLVLEDLQWGDVPSLQFVDRALRNLRERPILVLAVARADGEAAPAALLSSHPTTALRLGPLTKKASERLARAVLGDDADAVVIDRIVTHAAGNAFCLEELVRGVVEGRSGETSDTVIAMVQARVEALAADARRILRAASVFGPVFWREGVSQLLGTSTSLDLGEWLDELARREWLTPRPESRFPGTTEVAFRQATVREAAYVMLTDADRALAHRLAGTWLEAHGERAALVLAEHFRLGGEPLRAARAYAEAVRQALEGNDLDAVPRLAASAIACGAAGELLGELLVCEAEALRWRGANADAAARAREALPLLAAGAPSWYRALGELGMACGRTGEVEELVGAGRELLAARPHDGASASRRIAASRIAVQLFHSGRPEHGQLVLASAELGAEEARASQPLAAAWVDTARLGRALAEGDPGTAWACAQRAVEGCERAGDLRTATMQRVNVGFVAMELGAFDDAERTLVSAMDGAARLGLRDAWAIAASNLGLARVHLGRHAEARSLLGNAIRELGAQGNKLMEGCSRNYLALALLGTNDLEAAEREARAGAELTTKSPAARAYALATLARILVLRGEPVHALAAARVANAHIENVETAEEGDSAVRLALVESLRAVGDEPAARVALDAAVAHLHRRAARISDPELRAGFLSTPDHARTLRG